MVKSARGGFKSFRTPVRQVAALPPTVKNSVQVWRPKLNDKVQIPNGTGTVLEVSGDMYLVALDNQVAQVWERLTSIRVIQ